MKSMQTSKGGMKEDVKTMRGKEAKKGEWGKALIKHV